MVFNSLAFFRSLELEGILPVLSTTTLVGDLETVAPNLTVSWGSSISTVEIPTIIASQISLIGALYQIGF
jgi:hypothetical protein